MINPSTYKDRATDKSINNVIYSEFNELYCSAEYSYVNRIIIENNSINIIVMHILKTNTKYSRDRHHTKPHYIKNPIINCRLITKRYKLKIVVFKLINVKQTKYIYSVRSSDAHRNKVH